MAQEQPTQAGKNLFQDNTVIDADVHISHLSEDILGELKKHLDPPYDRLIDPKYPELLRATGEADAFAHTIPGKIDAIQADTTDPVTGIKEPLCERFGVDYAILNSLQPLDNLKFHDQPVQMMSAVNNVLQEMYLDDHDEFYGLIRVTTTKPDKAAEEIDRMAQEDDMVGVLIHSGETKKEVGHPDHDPIFNAAEENGLPIVLHTTANATQQWHHPYLYSTVEQYITTHAMAHPWDNMLAMASIVYQGVPEKFPGLNFVILETGLSWVPFTMYRLNREYQQRRYDAPLLEKSPEEYVRDTFYFGSQPLEEPNNPTDLRPILEILGWENILFATDHPHFDFDSPQAIEQYLRECTQEEKEMVLHSNAQEVFNI